jgi:methylated-DNA-[protein]-cysteine S-methyltransferase
VTASAVLTTPLGPLYVRVDGDTVTAVRWVRDGEPDDGGGGAAPALDTALAELDEYFAGQRQSFDVPIDLGGLGSFQRQVLDATVAIPYGRTRAYGEIAAELGRPELVRAVGGALKHNPIAVIVPCHRVVAADGSLTGYGGAPGAGGRVDTKRALLEIERGVFQQLLL